MGKEVKKDAFSEQDLLFLADRDFLKTKKNITSKIERLLIETQQTLEPFIKNAPLHLTENLLVRAGKISRGENYLDLPYQVLDYPRLFSKESVFTYRSMFWWGNFFSCTLHIQGEILNTFRSALYHTLPMEDDEDTYFCVNNSPWEYHYDKSNYIKLLDIPDNDLKHFIKERGFIKLSRKLPLKQYSLLPQFSLETVRRFYDLLLGSGKSLK